MWKLLGTAFKAASKLTWDTTKFALKHPIIAASGAETLDQTVNDGKATGSLMTRGFNAIARKIFGDTPGNIADKYVPEPVKEAGREFMGFMKEHPDLAKWGSFGAALFGGYKLFGGMIGFILGDNILTTALALGAAAIVAGNLSNSFTAAVNNFKPEEKPDQQNPAAQPKQPLPRPAM
jgi:hypothetical protein